MSETVRRFELQTLKAEFFKALGHPTRIRILEILRHGQRSVQELQQALRLDQSIVSQHLAILRAKNVVGTRKLGTTVRYTVRDAAVGELLDVARRTAPGGSLVVGGEPESSPLFAGRFLVDGAPAAYVCRGFVCDRPVISVSDLRAALAVG